MKNKLISVPSAAKFCSVSRWTIWKYVKSGDIPALQTPGGHYRIQLKDLISFIKKKGMHSSIEYESRIGRILIVDDDPGIRKMLDLALSKKGYAIETASNGFEAGIQIFKFKPDLVILDMVMADKNGFEICTEIKKNPETAHIKIFAITGYSVSESRDKIMAAGADAFMGKPLDLKLMFNKINDFLTSISQVTTTGEPEFSSEFASIKI